MIVIIWRNLSSGKKIKLILHISLEILQRFVLVVLGTLGMPGYVHPKYYQLRKLLCLSAGKKSTSWFSRDIAEINKIVLGTLGMPGYTNLKW